MNDGKVYDAADWKNIPQRSLCALYVDGEFAVTRTQVAKIRPTDMRWITVTGDHERASIIDGPPDNPMTPAIVRAFVRGRRHAGQDAIIYTPRAYAAEYLSILTDFSHGELADYEQLYWWIATLDGADWTAAELAASLAARWQAPIPARRLWAVQNNQLPEIRPSALVDVSKLFLEFRP